MIRQRPEAVRVVDIPGGDPKLDAAYYDFESLYRTAGKPAGPAEFGSYLCGRGDAELIRLYAALMQEQGCIKRRRGNG